MPQAELHPAPNAIPKRLAGKGFAAMRRITSVHLVGGTDLVFLVEWCGEKAGLLHFSHQADVDLTLAGAAPDTFGHRYPLFRPSR